ncbi:FimV/HubP family polar landmark protein, partial [Vibrio proteolyticus]
MRPFFKRLLLPLAMAAMTQTFYVSAQGIRLIGPNGEVQSAPQFSQPLTRASQQAEQEPSRFYGPTTESDTLWRIATDLRLSNTVTVQQTLLAIYQLNPKAFDNQNIHELIPGSTLRVPSLSQVTSVSTQEAVRVMDAHKARLNDAPGKAAPKVAQPAVKPQPVTKPEVKAEAPAKSDVAETAQPAKPSADTVPTDDTAPKTLTPPTTSAKPVGELAALEERNHQLRLMLAEVQSEVSVLKNELNDESRIRDEVERLLAEERARNAKDAQLAPGPLDKLMSNTWLVGALAVIPGLLIALLVTMLLGRRKSEPAQQTEVQPPVTDPVMPVTPPPAMSEQDELDDLTDELLLDDDLFGSADDDEEQLFDDSSEEAVAADSDDIFADLKDSELDFNLEGEDGDDPFAGIGDDGELDADLLDMDSSSNGISVKGDDKALGLEEMERALDEVITDTSQAQSNFDLADDEQVSQDDLDDLLSGSDKTASTDGELDQAMLDELLSGDADTDDSADDLDIDALLASGSDSPEYELSDVEMASDDEIDALFAKAESQADLDQLDALSQDETALLDEMLDDDDLELSEDSTELLDELLDHQTAEPATETDDEAERTEESDTLLDELLDEQDDVALAEQSDLMLDELLDLDEQPASLNDDSTDLLEELLATPETPDEQDHSFEPDGTEFLDELNEIEKL